MKFIYYSNRSALLWLLTAWLFVSDARSELITHITPPKTVGAKSDTKLELENTFTEKIESARATLFLINDQGKVTGQATHWVIGGTQDRPALAPGAKTTFHFVVPLDKTGATNLQPRLVFNRVVLDGGKLADPAKEVRILNAQQ